MTEYKCVNFSELCRLCASSNGPRVGIYSDEGRKKKIHNKITETLGINVNETDRLPKSVCAVCLKQVEAHVEFRETAVKAQGMLESCLNSRSVENAGKVYIRDEVGIKTDSDTSQTAGQQQMNQPQVLTIQNQQQPNQQYTFTLDASTARKGGILQYKLGNNTLIPVTSKPAETQPQTTFTQDEFIKIKATPPNPLKRESPPNVKTDASKAKRRQVIQIVKHPGTPQAAPPKTTNVGNFTIESSTITSPIAVATPVSSSGMIVPNTGTVYTSTPHKTYNLPVKLISSNNRCLVPIVLKNDGTTEDSANNNSTPNISVVGQQMVNNAPQNHQMMLQVELENGALRLAHPPLAMQQTTLPQYGMATIATNAQPVTAMPPMTILGQNQQLVQAQLAHAATAPKQTIVINGQKGSGGKSSSAAGRTGHVITSSNISNVSSLSSTSENRSVSDHDSSGNETAESEANRTAQSLVASQQMSAISAMSSKQDAVASDQQTKTSNGRPGERGANVSGRTGGDVSITTCNVCRKTFGRKEHLVQHLKSHIGLRPFKCDAPECNKTFSRKEHLIRHTVSHTGQKMFICDKCQKPFSRKDNLNKHRNCNVCNKDFSSKNQFLKHKDSCFEEETDPPKPTIKKQPVTTVKTEPKQQAGNTITVLESTIVSKSSQPPPLAHAPLTSVVTSDPPQPTTVVQSLPLTITANHVPTNSATIQLPIQPQ
uniref:Protein krueppel n=1 Tax=Anopheles culicifacies TaxID=139723 RepID=A0A182MVM2_9DIPT